MFAILLSSKFAGKTFLLEFADGDKGEEEKKRKRDGDRGIWEPLMGTQSFGHRSSVTLTFRHGEGGEELKACFFFSCGLLPQNCFATGYNLLRQQSVNLPTA